MKDKIVLQAKAAQNTQCTCSKASIKIYWEFYKVSTWVQINWVSVSAEMRPKRVVRLSLQMTGSGRWAGTVRKVEGWQQFVQSKIQCDSFLNAEKQFAPNKAKKKYSVYSLTWLWCFRCGHARSASRHILSSFSPGLASSGLEERFFAGMFQAFWTSQSD